MGIKKIKPIINIYIKELKKSINPQKVVVFGSYAKNTAVKDSDIDLIVLSKDFKNLSFDKRLSLLNTSRLNPKTRKISMDIFGYTQEEFENASPLTTLGEAKETGVTVYSS